MEILGIIGSVLTLIIMFATSYNENKKKIEAKHDALEKEILDAKSFTDFVRISDKLRNK